MRLVDVKGEPECYVICLKCGHWGNTAKMKADLDGPPFKAYYHPECIAGTAHIPENPPNQEKPSIIKF